MPVVTKQWAPKSVLSLRKKAGLTQPQFALKLGVGEATVVRWENGVNNPSRHTARLLNELAAAL